MRQLLACSRTSQFASTALSKQSTSKCIPRGRSPVLAQSSHPDCFFWPVGRTILSVRNDAAQLDGQDCPSYRTALLRKQRPIRNRMYFDIPVENFRKLALQRNSPLRQRLPRPLIDL